MAYLHLNNLWNKLCAQTKPFTINMSRKAKAVILFYRRYSFQYFSMTVSFLKTEVCKAALGFLTVPYTEAVIIH